MTLDDVSRVEWFGIFGWCWDVTAAKACTADRPPDGHVAVADWAALARLVRVEPCHADGVDLAEPVIAVPVPYGGTLIIDGWHRVHKALAAGFERLPVRTLTAAEELACRIHGGEKRRLRLRAA